MKSDGVTKTPCFHGGFLGDAWSSSFIGVRFRGVTKTLNLFFNFFNSPSSFPNPISSSKFQTHFLYRSEKTNCSYMLRNHRRRESNIESGSMLRNPC